MAEYVHSANNSKPLAPILLLGSLLAVAVLYVNAQYPNLLPNLQYQLLGTQGVAVNTAAQDRESARVTQINSLIISGNNKNDLREGRPFWGAAAHMVELAFGHTSDDIIIRRQGARIYEFHRYGFGGNREAVVMEFANNALTCVHYPQRTRTVCSPGARSYYSGQPFPFSYEVRIGN